MVLKKYAKTVDGTIPVPALLYDDEDLLASQEGVGIYDGPQKSAHHQAGIVHITTHRLFYIDIHHPRSRSFSLDLWHVSRTEYYAGLFTSSPKVTLYLASITSPTFNGTPAPNIGVPNDASNSWECEVCSYRNPPGLSPSASRVCALCGVPRASMKSPIAISKNADAKLISSSVHNISTSLPSSSLNLAQLTAPSPLSISHVDQRERGSDIACPACTFLNHSSLRECEICGTALPRPASHQPAKSAPTSRPISPSMNDDDNDADDDGFNTPETRIIRISFRKGGDKNFYGVMKRSLLGKAWEDKGADIQAVSPVLGATGQSGINSILRTVESTAASSQSSMEDALHDLEALMIKWKGMVRLAQDLNERLTAATASQNAASTATSSPVEPEEATFIRSSLAQLGLQMTNAPVTLDMIRDERKWIEELARELAGVLQGGRDDGMMRRRGIIALDEVWGGWNRARGVALIPPSTFLLVLPHLPNFTSPPIHMRTFSSTGLSVLHTPPYTRAAFAARLVGHLYLAGPKITVEIAQEEDLPIGLVQEMVEEVEFAGDICRDQGGGGVSIFSVGSKDTQTSDGGYEVHWWVNVFRGYVWDGQED